MVGKRVWFTKELRLCISLLVVSIQMNKKESVICEFEMVLKTSFCGGFNLSNDDKISVLFKHVMLRFVTLFQGMDFRDQV